MVSITTEGVIQFSGDRVIAGLAFHVMEGIYIDDSGVLFQARACHLSSFEKHLKRARRILTRPALISRNVWREWDDFHRALWLLKQIDCEYLLNGEGICRLVRSGYRG